MLHMHDIVDSTVSVRDNAQRSNKVWLRSSKLSCSCVGKPTCKMTMSFVYGNCFNQDALDKSLAALFLRLLSELACNRLETKSVSTATTSTAANFEPLRREQGNTAGTDVLAYDPRCYDLLPVSL